MSLILFKPFKKNAKKISTSQAKGNYTSNYFPINLIGIAYDQIEFIYIIIFQAYNRRTHGLYSLQVLTKLTKNSQLMIHYYRLGILSIVNWHPCI